MIPAGSITATLEADLSYNPNIHVQTVEIDRTGTNMWQMATDNFVKWYITLKDFQNLCWNVRELPSYPRDASDNDQSNNIYAFARSGDFYSASRYGTDPYTVPAFAGTDASYAEEGGGTRQSTGGILLQQEASGGTVKFNTATLNFYVPLATDSPLAGNDAGAGTEAQIGNTVVSYDRVMLNEDASGSISSSTTNNLRTEASTTTSTWSFVDSSFGMTVNWVGSGRSGTSDYNATSYDSSTFDASTNWSYAGNQYWGNNVIHVYANAGSTIRVNKPYNDAAADFIQIGMDARGTSTDFSSGVGYHTSGNLNLRGLGNTAYGVAPGDSTSSYNTGAFTSTHGLIDPLDSTGNNHGLGGMDNSVADDVNDSIDFAAYLSDYTTTHVDQARNLIKVQIGKPTLKISETNFTKALQQAIDQDMSDVLRVHDTQSLRYAVRDAFHANHLRGFQCGVGTSDQNTHTANKVTLNLPLTVAGQTRYVQAAATAGSETGQDAAAGAATSTDDGTGTNHKAVYLTPIIELVADSYQHPSAWYTYRDDC